ncbi:hypothetical protein DYBT9623_04750 [Dyadobacter sp. CECT 9623]|uniref:Uncharacterized protein n=1 Tax=Dyadobacter linearis TaxID=2823330 RepID=A0ABM8UWK5_9BACT|nr:hypothetical protein [Dyadobacter sp. CECT 9623]CAG5073261.1 hypothetical protein DYBT9623_04750 [Dyadobacter sp. CECT 9623]
MTTYHFQNIFKENLYLSSDFPLAGLTNAERELAANIQCIRFAFAGPANDINVYDSLFKECTEYLFEKFFKGDEQNTYLVLAKGNLSVVKLDQHNFNSHIHLILDSRTCFVISSEQELSAESFANIKFLNRPGDTIPPIDYLKLVFDHCPKGATIYKMSGDGGDNYIAIDAFESPKTKKTAG